MQEAQEVEGQGINRRAFLGIAGAGAAGATLVGVTAAAAWPDATTAPAPPASQQLTAGNRLFPATTHDVDLLPVVGVLT